MTTGTTDRAIITALPNLAIGVNTAGERGRDVHRPLVRCGCQEVWGSPTTGCGGYSMKITIGILEICAIILTVIAVFWAFGLVPA